MVSGVVTQPRTYEGNVEVVTRYDVEYSLDDDAWVQVGSFLGPTV